MLKTSEYLRTAELAIRARKYAGTGQFQLTYALGQMICRRQSLCTANMPNFACFTDHQALIGFTTKQWEQIFKKMLDYFENHKRPQLPAAQPAAGQFHSEE